MYEQGWDIQVLVEHNPFILTPDVYDAKGLPVDIRKSDPKKGFTDVSPKQSLALSVPVRVARGVADALITAVLPVLTVAVAQIQDWTGPGLGIDKLVLLGFTSQAIRTAILPETTPATPAQTEAPRSNAVNAPAP